ADGKVHVIKITRNNTELELQVDDDDDRGSITIPGNNDVMNLHDEDPHFVGGVPSDYDKAVFAEKDINWNGFVGCIQVVKPNQLHELDLDHPVRSQRQEPGCTFKEDKLISADRVIGFPKPGYLVAESIQLNTNSSLAFNLKTKNGNAVLLYQKSLKKTFKREADDNDTFFAFYLYNGRLIVHLGTDTVDRLKRPSISSNQSYNDGRLHSIFFARQGSSIEVRIDDREVLRGQLSDDKIIGSKTSKLYFGGLPDKLRIKNENIDIGTTEP
uniref:Laminin G domain-containing protein n=1 Tax=Panagrolaimus sp. JU765 TaxID=591449 RepID=A0AC34R150_9BILA